MLPGRVARQVDRLLSEAEQAMAAGDWAAVRARSEAVLRLDPTNSDAGTYLRAAGGASKAAPSAERRHMAVMFCDLRHSTELSDGADPEDLRQIILPYHQAAARVVEAFDGHIAHYMGDGILAYFGYPTAHEDDADRAIRAALGIIAAVHELPGLPGGGLSEVRVGVHFGLALVAQMGSGGRIEPHDVIGETANIASRVQALARPMTVVVTAEVAGLTRHAFALLPLGTRSLRGLARTFELFEVAGEDAAAEPTPDHVPAFVGRESQLALLGQAWRGTLEGHGSTFLIVGEAGIGKSRLCQEFLDRLRGSDYTAIQIRGSAFHQDSAFRPIIQYISRTVLELDEDAASEEASQRLHGSLEALDPGLTEYEAHIASLLGISSAEDGAGLPKDATVQSLAAWIVAVAATRPVLLLVEDAHWLDPSTVETLQSIAPIAGDHRLLVLLTTRPSLTLYSAFDDVERIPLERLDPEEALALAESLAARYGLGDNEVRAVVARGDGIPLYLEVLMRQAAVAEGELSSVTSTTSIKSGVPPALFGALMARLDALGPLRTVAHAASVLGREVSPARLAQVTGRPVKSVQLDCEQLREAQILRWVPRSQVYVFTHALIQDVAYESMTRADRSTRHLEVARTLERAFPVLIETEPETLAFHYDRGGDAERAVHYVRLAARLALARSANREAVSLLQRAVQILETQLDKSEEELDTRIELGPPLIATTGYSSPAVEANYERALEVSRRLQDAERSFHALNGMRRFHQVRGGPARCAAIVDELLGRASGTGDPYLLGVAQLAAGEIAVLTGRPTEGLDHLRKAESLLGEALTSGRTESRDYWVTARAYQGLALWFGGATDGARAATTAAAERARDLESPYGMVYSLVLRAWVGQLAKQPEAVSEDAREANRLAIEHGFAYWEVASRCLDRWAAAMGRENAALLELERAVNEYVASGARTAETWLFSLLAEARIANGDGVGAQDAVRRAREAAVELGEHFMDAEIVRLSAEASAALTDRVTAPEAIA